MKIKPGFELRTICGENFIIAKGAQNINFIKIINLNESATYLWNNVLNKDFDAPLMASLLQQEYDVDPDTALADATELLTAWQNAGLCE